MVHVRYWSKQHQKWIEYDRKPVRSVTRKRKSAAKKSAAKKRSASKTSAKKRAAPAKRSKAKTSAAKKCALEGKRAKQGTVSALKRSEFEQSDAKKRALEKLKARGIHVFFEGEATPTKASIRAEELVSGNVNSRREPLCNRYENFEDQIECYANHIVPNYHPHRDRLDRQYTLTKIIMEPDENELREFGETRRDRALDIAEALQHLHRMIIMHAEKSYFKAMCDPVREDFAQLNRRYKLGLDEISYCPAENE